MAKNYRKFVVSSMAATAAVAAVAPAVSADTGFTDVEKGDTHYEGIMALAEQGIVSGYADGSFGVYDKVTRQQVAVMLYQAMDLDVPAETEKILEVYTDVNGDSLYAEQIAAVTSAGAFVGSDGEFMPGQNITRQQMASTLVSGLNLDKYDTGDDVDVNLDNVGKSHKDAVQTLANLGLTVELNDFRPHEDISRGAFATMLNAALNVDKSDEATLAVESVNAVANSDKTATISGKVSGAKKVEIALTSFDTGQTTTHTVDVKDNEYTFTTNNLPPSRYSAEVTAINGNEKSESSKADFVIIAASTGFSGFVTDDEGNGVNGVTVEVDGKTTKTDSTGFYLIENVTTDQYHDVKFSKAGLVTKVEPDNRVRDGKATVVNTEVKQLSASNIEIESTAVDAKTGEALTGATVELFAKDSYLDDWFKIGETQVDSEGDFNLDQSDVDPDNGLELGGTYKVEVTHGDIKDNDLYNGTEREFTLKTDDVQNVLDGFALDAVKPLNITGKVISNESPVDQEEVKLIAADGSTELASVSTEKDGTYKILNANDKKLKLPTGKYFLEVVNEGVTNLKAIDVTEGQNITQNFDLAIQGTGFDFKLGAKTPEQLSNGEYTFELFTKEGGHIETAASVDANDTAEIEANFGNKVPAGDYVVRVKSDYSVPTDYDVTITESEVTAANKDSNPETPVKGADVVKGATVSGTVDVKGNVPGADKENVLVQLLNKEGSVVSATDIDASGAYNFVGVPAGKYTVKTFKYGYIADSGEFTVKLNENSDPASVDQNDFTSLALELKPIPTTGTLKGNVREEGSLKSVDNKVTATLYNALGNYYEQEVTTSGEYDFNGVAPGVYTLVLRGDDYETNVVDEVTVTAGNTITENITVNSAPQAGIELTFVDSDNKEVNAGTFGVTLADEYADVSNSNDAGIISTTANPAAFEELSAGKFTYYFTSGEYQNFSSTITLSEKEDYKAVVGLTDAGVTYDVTVNVVDKDNNPADGSEVIVVDSNNNRVGGPEALDANGKAEFNLANGDYKALVYENGYFVGTQEFSVNRGDMTLDTIRLVEFK